MKKLIIESRYFNELLNNGNTVPRDNKTGNTLSLSVGKTYAVYSTDKAATPIDAKCTQNCPCSLVKFNPTN
jgi:hypothetical protein